MVLSTEWSSTSARQRKEAPSVPDLLNGYPESFTELPLSDLGGQTILDAETPPEEETFHCAHCGVPHSDEDDARSCCHAECENCGTETLRERLYWNDNTGSALCEDCDAEHRYHCGSCGSEHSSDEEAYDCCRYQCEGCGATHDYQEDAISCCRDEDIDADGTSVPSLSEKDHYQITVPVIFGRPARICSIEQELADGGRTVAGLLYEQGITDENGVYGYHWSGSRPGLIHVESDGSLPSEGGEVIYDRFDLSSETDSRRLSKVVGKIRQLRDEHKLVKTSFAAGIHIHISAKDQNGNCLSTRDLAALYELWSYAEDMLYSLSASGWNRHRQPSDNYGGYCKAVPKFSGEATPAKVWRAMRSDRYYGLNFQRMFSAATRCSCGAGEMGDWNDCSCGAFDGATVEWRVFNASTLPRTIHAWTVMAHAITAYAMEHEIGSLPVNAYGSQSREEKREVLDWLLDRLPLTEGEKAVIEDAADRSPGL
jgi:hypothetical protein